MARPGFCRGGRRVGVRVTPWKTGDPPHPGEQREGRTQTQGTALVGGGLRDLGGGEGREDSPRKLREVGPGTPA